MEIYGNLVTTYENFNNNKIKSLFTRVKKYLTIKLRIKALKSTIKNQQSKIKIKNRKSIIENTKLKLKNK
jgi:hypothetical protein